MEVADAFPPQFLPAYPVGPSGPQTLILRARVARPVDGIDLDLFDTVLAERRLFLAEMRAG